MTFTNPGQAQSFFGALFLGAAAGMLYDGLRVIRFRLGGRLLGALLDLLFWAAVTGALFCYSVAAGNGLVRIYMMAAMFGGGVLYFLSLSPLILRLGFRLADLARVLGDSISAPFRFLKGIAKKIRKISKNLFHYLHKWVKIKMVSKDREDSPPQAERHIGHIGAYRNESKNQTKTRGLSDQDRGGGSAGVYGDHAAQPERQNPGRGD